MVNPIWLSCLGYTRDQIQGRWFGDLLTDSSRRVFQEQFAPFIQAGESHGLHLELVRADGSTLWAEFEGKVSYGPDGIFQQTHCMFQDISQRKSVEDSQQVLLRILKVAQTAPHLDAVLEESVAAVQAFFQCEAVGIRLLDAQGNVPYEAYAGFPESFYRKESPLSVARHHCMCIDVIKGTLDSTLPFVTAGGSFFMNGTTRFLATVSEEDKGRTRNTCNQYGYESVALVPIRQNGHILGLIHVADARDNRVPPEKVMALETVALQLATIVQRFRVEERLTAKEATERALLDSITESAILMDTQATILAVNTVAAGRLNKTPDELIGVCAYDLIARDLAEKRKQKLMEVVRTGRSLAFEDVHCGRTLDQRLCPVFSDGAQACGTTSVGLSNAVKENGGRTDPDRGTGETASGRGVA